MTFLEKLTPKPYRPQEEKQKKAQQKSDPTQGWSGEKRKGYVPPGWQVNVPKEDEAQLSGGPYNAEPKTPEQLKAMSAHERLQYAEDLKTEREFRQSKGVTKGVLSGATLGLSELVPGLDIKEGEYGDQFGKIVGSTLPITGLMKIYATPLVKMAAKSPIFQKQLTSLAKVTGLGLSGATYGSVEQAAHGDMPTVDDVIGHGVDWVVLDGALNAVGKGYQFAKGLTKIATEKSKPAYQILKNIVARTKASGATTNERIAEEAFNVLAEEAQLPPRKPKSITESQEQSRALSSEVQPKPKINASQIGQGILSPEAAEGRLMQQGDVSRKISVLPEQVEKTALENVVEDRFNPGTRYEEPAALEKQAGFEQEAAVAERHAEEVITEQQIDNLARDNLDIKRDRDIETLSKNKQREFEKEKRRLTKKRNSLPPGAPFPEEVSPIELKDRKVSQVKLAPLMKETEYLSEPYQMFEFNFIKEAEALENSALRSEIDAIGERAPDRMSLGDRVKKNINENRAKERAEYKPLYDEAKDKAKYINHTPENTARIAGEEWIRLSRMKTKPEGYSKTIKQAENVLEDAGYKIQRDENGVFERIVQEREVPVSDSIELGIRLNEIADYEAIEPSVKDAIKRIVKETKKDIRVGLKKDPDALAAFELAEAEHARVAEKYGSEAVQKIRSTEAGETIANMTKSPTVLQELRNTLSPKEMLQVERELLEELADKSYEQSKKMLRDVKSHLSKENAKLANKIVDSMNPHNLALRKTQKKQGILDDMADAFTNSTRPDKTLNLWKTPNGQKLIKEAFQDSPNWKEVKWYLETQSFNDLVKSVMHEGKIDLGKLKTFLKDPATESNIRSMGGKDAVIFFRNLESEVKSLESNLKKLDRFPTQEEFQEARKIGRGEEILAKVKEREIEAKKAAVSREKARVEHEKSVIEAQEKDRAKGEKKLEKTAKRNLLEQEEAAAEKARVPTKGTEILETRKGQKRTESQRQEELDSRRRRGKTLLFRMAEKDFPMQIKGKKWIDWFKNNMGLSEKVSLTVFGLMKLGMPHTIAALIGGKMLLKLATNPSVRRAFQSAAKHRTNPLAFIIAMENFGNLIDEE